MVNGHPARWSNYPNIYAHLNANQLFPGFSAHDAGLVSLQTYSADNSSIL